MTSYCSGVVLCRRCVDAATFTCPLPGVAGDLEFGMQAQKCMEDELPTAVCAVCCMQEGPAHGTPYCASKRAGLQLLTKFAESTPSMPRAGLTTVSIGGVQHCLSPAGVSVAAGSTIISASCTSCCDSMQRGKVLVRHCLTAFLDAGTVPRGPATVCHSCGLWKS